MKKFLLLAGLAGLLLNVGCETTSPGKNMPEGDLNYEPRALITTSADSAAGASVMIGVKMKTDGLFPVIFNGRPDPGPTVNAQAWAPPKPPLIEQIISSPGRFMGWSGGQIGKWWDWSREHPGQSTASALAVILAAGEMTGSDISFSGIADMITGDDDDDPPPSTRSLPSDGERATVIAANTAVVDIRDADQLPNIIADGNAAVRIDQNVDATISRNAGL